MDNRHAVLFHDVEPPLSLKIAVLARIALSRQRAARFRFAAHSAGAMVSFALLVIVSRYAFSEMYTSGFYEYLSLFFSDSAALLYWRQLLISLTESLPSLAILLVLVVGAMLSWSFRRAARDIQTAFLTPVFITR